MKTKKILALLLAALMMLSCLAACSDEGGSETTPTPGGSNPSTTTPPVEEDATYTFYDYNAVTPNTWNPHTYETEDSNIVMSYITMGLYDFDFNEDHPEYGYVIKPEMAASNPVDVTKDYAGDPKWNVPAGATEGYVYKIALNEAAVWEDGTPINADTYIYSMQQLLDPNMQNYRADSYYIGSLVMTNAQRYAYQGQTAETAVSTYMGFEGIADLTEWLTAHADDDAYVNWNYSFGETYDFATGTWTAGGEDAVVKAGCTISELYDLFVAKVAGEWGYPESTAVEFFLGEAYAMYTYPEIEWDTVGLQKTGEYEITMYLDKPLTGFYLYYNLSGNWIVHEETYEANKKAAAEGSDLMTSTYHTSLDTTMSYGPYKLVEFQDDKVVKLTRNDKWYGYTDGNHEGKYQTTDIVVNIVKENSTALEMFLKGQIDIVGLDSDQVADYRASDYIYYTLSSYTGNLFIQANYDALLARQEPGKNKTVLTIYEFRKALAWSLDRADFAASTTASSSAGFGLLNSRYIADVENIIPYRNYDAAKQTICDVYGVEWGAGKEYATLDEAYAAVTGYDLDGAKVLFDEAYDKAIASGLMQEGDVVSMLYSTYEDNESTRKTFNYLEKAWTNAVKGTKFEGKIELVFDATAGDDFAKNFQNGISDLLIAGWSGAEMDPFYFMLAYLNANYRYAQSFDPTQELTLTIAGQTLTMSLEDWYNAMMGDSAEYNFGPGAASMEDRIAILAALEAAVLQDYSSCPLTYGSSASLKSMKINYYIEEYNELLGRGGIAYFTYNFTDAEWDEYVAEQGGTLNYQ